MTELHSSDSQQFGQAGEIVGGHCQDEATTHPLCNPTEGPGRAADGFDPEKATSMRLRCQIDSA